MADGSAPREQVSELRNSIAALARRLRQSARADNETWTGLMTLGVIQRAGGRATPTQVASEMQLRSSNLAQILGGLDERGLIERTPDPTDKRKVRLAITEAGLNVIEQTRAQRDEWLSDAMTACLSPAEQSQLIAAGDLIRRIATPGQSALRQPA